MKMKKLLAMLKKLLGTSSKGFTLIELLVVIAVIGVLAGIVIVAINPTEQINKGKDSGRMNAVNSLSTAMQAYYTNQGVTGYPTVVAATWQNLLTADNDINAPVAADTTGMSTCTVNSQNGICYANFESTNAAIWVTLGSSANSNKAFAGGCVTGLPTFMWIASQGKAGYTCITAATTPTSSQTLKQ
jgi:prepilin-type N-terminal cleavage/methylation domain-containing protein